MATIKPSPGSPALPSTTRADDEEATARAAPVEASAARPFQPGSKRAARADSAPPATGAGQPGYTVKAGDALSHIAKRHSVTLAALLKANPHLTTAARRKGDLIFPGDAVVIPGRVIAAQPTAAQRKVAARQQATDQQAVGQRQAETSAVGSGATEATSGAGASARGAASAAAAPGTPEAAAAPLTTEEAAQVIKPMIAAGMPEGVSRLAAASARARDEDKNVGKLLDATKGNPAALVEQLQSPANVHNKLVSAVAVQGSAQARANGTLEAMRAEVQAQLERPELKAALTELDARNKLAEDKREERFTKLSGAERLNLVTADRTRTFGLALEIQARIEDAKGDPAKLVEAFTSSKPGQGDIALVAVVREAKKLGKLQELFAAIKARAEPASKLTEAFRAKLNELQATSPEAAKAALDKLPPDVVEATRVIHQLTPLADVVAATLQVASAKGDATKLAAISLSVPNSARAFTLQEIVETSRASGPDVVAALHDSVVDLIAQNGGQTLAALRAQPESKQAEFFAALPAQEQARLFIVQRLETLRDVIAIEATVARSKGDPAKLIVALTKAVTPEEADAIIRTALALPPPTAESSAALMKATHDALKSFAPVLEKRSAAVRAKTSTEDFQKTLTPAEKASLATAERIAGLRNRVAAANIARLDTEAPQNIEEIRLKPDEPLGAAAVKSLESQLRLGDKQTLSNALKDLEPKLQGLQAFAAAVTSPEIANSVVGDIPVKALMASLTPPHGRAELIVPNKKFEVAGGVLDTVGAHDVMIKVVDANNDATFYALPRGARRQMDMAPNVASKLRAAYEKANGLGDGESGLLETVRTTFAGLPSDATQAQLNAAIELLRKNDQEAHAQVIAAFAFKATFNDHPMNPKDLGTLLTETRSKSPDDFATIIKGVVSDEKLRESKDLEPLLKELASGDDASKARFKVLQDRVAAMATTLPVASIRFLAGADGKPTVTLKTSLVGVKEGSTVLADVDLGRMKGFAKKHGEAFAQSYFASHQLSDHAPKTYASPIELDNMVADALKLGFNDKARDWAKSVEGQAQLKAGKAPDFAVYTEGGKPAVMAVADQINAITSGRGPDAKPEVEITPLMHLTNDGRTVPVNLLKVTGADGPKFVDMRGNRYTSFKHYRETNQEGPGTLLAPKDGVLELDEQGQVKVDSFFGGLTVTSVASMNWVNENLLTARTLDNVSWVLTGAGAITVATVIGGGAGIGMMALGQGMRTAAVAGTRSAIAGTAAKKMAGEALFHGAKLGHWATAPLVDRLMLTAVGRFGVGATQMTALGGGAAFMAYGLANVVPQIGWVNEHSELGAWDTWSPALDFKTQQGYAKRQLVSGAAMTALGIVGMGSGLAMSRVLSNPIRVEALIANPTFGGKALANTALYSNAINLPITAGMTWDMMMYRRQFGGLMDGEMRSSLEANVMMNTVGVLTGLLTAVDVNAMALRGTHIDPAHYAYAVDVAANPTLPTTPSISGLQELLKKKPPTTP